jgi:hypothetical protein
MRTKIALGILLTLAFGSPAYATEAQESTRLVIELDHHALHGEQHQVTVFLTDSRGRPLSGEAVTLFEELRLFDYVGMGRVAELRTDYRGGATFAHTPVAEGNGLVTAEYRGSATYLPATTTVVFSVGQGTGLADRVIPEPGPPILPRGVTAAWFLPLLVGVWLSLAAVVYHMVRIPREGETAPGVV